MQVSQIFITDGNEPLPPFLEDSASSVRSAFSHLNYVLYNNEQLRNFLSASFPPEVIRAYDVLTPYAYKADLGRYCLLYELGGWYVDMGIRMLMKPNPPDTCSGLAFRDTYNPGHSNTCFACSTSILFSRANSTIFESAINRVLANVSSQFYGTSPVDPTGPTVLGQALSEIGPDSGVTIGEVTRLTPSFPKENRAYLLPDGQIMAFDKPRHIAPGGDLSGLGVKGSNNYGELWRQKKIYSESIS